jgi:MFS superfamily sulfate permease-like transporter
MCFVVLRLAKLVRIIRDTTGMIGFMNGLAIIITATQMPTFLRCDAAALFVDCIVEEREWHTSARS